MELRDFLTGGTRLDQARSSHVLAMALKDQEAVAELARLCDDPDRLVAMRSLDLMEKIARVDRPLVEPYKSVFLGPLARSDMWETRLQIARAIPLFAWSPADRKRATETLVRYIEDHQKFVKSWALDSLAIFSETDPSLRPLVDLKIDEFLGSGSPAMRARAKAIAKRLGS